MATLVLVTGVGIGLVIGGITGAVFALRQNMHLGKTAVDWWMAYESERQNTEDRDKEINRIKDEHPWVS